MGFPLLYTQPAAVEEKSRQDTILTDNFPLLKPAVLFPPFLSARTNSFHVDSVKRVGIKYKSCSLPTLQ